MMSRSVAETSEPTGGTMDDRPKVTLTDGSPVTADHREIIEAGPRQGQQKAYVVLSEEERTKGFIRPVRRSYQHVGPPPPATLRDLDEEDHARYDKFGYVKFEPYGEDRLPVTGRYWTQGDMDRLAKGCGVVTTMGQSLAETYARDPFFYSGTFCCACGTHFPVGESGEFVWDGTDERVGS